MSDEIYEHLKEQASFNIEFVDEKDNYHRLNSHIKGLFDDYILIASPNSKGNFPKLPDNSEINIIFTRNNGVLIARCMVLGKEPDEQAGIKISFPYETNIIERRKLVRVSLKLNVEVFYHENEDSAEEKTFFATTRNISGNGLCYLSKQSLKNSCNIQCKIHLQDENPKSVKVNCNLVYSKKVKLKDKISYLTALVYTSISDEDSTRIVKECFKYQINRKHVEQNRN